MDKKSIQKLQRKFNSISKTILMIGVFVIVFTLVFALIPIRIQTVLAEESTNLLATRCNLDVIGQGIDRVDYSFSPVEDTPLHISRNFQFGVAWDFGDLSHRDFCAKKGLFVDIEVTVWRYAQSTWKDTLGSLVSIVGAPFGVPFKLPGGGQLVKKTNFRQELKSHTFTDKQNKVRNTMAIKSPMLKLSGPGLGITDVSDPNDYKDYAYFKFKIFEKGVDSKHQYIPVDEDSYAFYRELTKTGEIALTPEITSEFALTGDLTTLDKNKVLKISDFNVTAKPDKNGKGLRSKYRVLINDVMKFGETPSLDPIYLEWTSPSINIQSKDTYFELPAKDDSWGHDTNPVYNGVGLGLNFASNIKDYSQCGTGTFVNTCEKNLFLKGSVTPIKDFGEASVLIENLPNYLKPNLWPGAWQSKIDSTKKSQNGEALGSVEFAVVPLIAGAKSGIPLSVIDVFIKNSAVIVLLGKSPPKFIVEVYEKPEHIIAACKTDLASAGADELKKCDDINFAKFGFASTITTSTSSSETGETGEAGVVGDLFNFLRKVIAYIVLLLTSLIYWIFGTILVPVLTALIQIHPYKDQFVNFIYPGWIIIRNISNIVFIVALLIMGLKLLFQQADTGKARSFIVTLVLMALLVNFSLVIAQGIVAVADTVQAQFLPADSKVIQSLAGKLMVDPIHTFRGSSSLASGGEFTADAFASDLPKAIVLLILAVAAFFAFVALAAFMFIRIVVLWVLYMLSPLAYVGNILPETQKYASQWWSEFIKYAFVVPILAFFLNITALMAVTFSRQSGDQVQIEGASDYWFGTIAAGITEYALTVVSHFVVLLFLFIGMKFALTFGGYGAEKIVGAAKSGFDAVVKKGPKALGMWGKDFFADKTGGLLQKKGFNKSAAALTALFKPVKTGAMLKDNLFTKPKAAREKRFDQRLSPLDRYSSQVGMNPWQAFKMAALKMGGGSAARLQPELKGLMDNADILTDEERAGHKGEIDGHYGTLQDIENRRGQHKVKVSEAAAYSDQLGSNMDDLQAEYDQRITDLSAQEATARAGGLTNTADQLQAQILADIDAHDATMADLQAKKQNLDQQIDMAGGREKGDADMQIGQVEVLNGILQISTDKVMAGQAGIDKLQNDLDTDTGKRDYLSSKGYLDKNKPVTVDVVRGLQGDIQKLQTKIKNRSFPADMYETTERHSRENEAGKPYADIEEWGTLEQVFENAIKKGEMDLATHVVKKLVKSGGFKILLKNNGYNNNTNGLNQFINDHYKDASPATQMAITHEISYLSGANGNWALAKATKMDANLQISPNSAPEQREAQKKLTATKPLWSKKPTEIFQDDNNGNKELLPGQLEEIKNYQGNKEKLRKVRQVHWEVAKDILAVAGGSLTRDVHQALSEAAGQSNSNP